MKYVLVDRGDNIVDRVDLGSGVGESGARTYFIKRKQICGTQKELTGIVLGCNPLMMRNCNG